MGKGAGRGYLESDFRVFYLNDIPRSIICMHYHDFRKIVVLLDGAIDYAVEEQQYPMRAGDVMLVEAGSMHRPILAGSPTYERIIIYLSETFFTARPGLDELFVRSKHSNHYLLSASAQEKRRIVNMAKSLLDDACSKSRFPLLLQQSRMNEFLIELNDIAAASDCAREHQSVNNDSVKAAIQYINEHLTEDLSTHRIAESVHLTESYLMHLFKKETGKTIRSFVMDKRLFLSGFHLSRGCTAAEACALSGFSSYSSFYRAYMDRYGTSPKSMSGIHLLAGQEPVE